MRRSVSMHITCFVASESQFLRDAYYMQKLYVCVCVWESPVINALKRAFNMKRAWVHIFHFVCWKNISFYLLLVWVQMYGCVCMELESERIHNWQILIVLDRGWRRQRKNRSDGVDVVVLKSERDVNVYRVRGWREGRECAICLQIKDT